MLDSNRSIKTTVETTTGRGSARAPVDEVRALRELLAQRTRQLEASEARLMEVAEASRHQEELAAIASHDMRSPLSAILGYADLLDMGVVEVPPAAREYVKRIRSSAQQVQVLLDQLFAGR